MTPAATAPRALLSVYREVPGELFQLKKQAPGRRAKQPAIDDTLYFL